MEPSNSQEELDPLASTPSHAESADISTTSSNSDSSDLNDDNLSSESDDSGPIEFVNFDAIVIFKIDINPDTLEPVYTLRAVPYLHGRDPYESPEDNAQYIREREKPFYDFVNRQGRDEILALLPKLYVHSFEIDRVHYYVKPHSVIRGTFANYFLSEYDCKFDYNMLDSFISYIDLVLRQRLHVDESKLAEEFDYQHKSYGIELLNSHIQRIKSLLRREPANRREAELKRYESEYTTEYETEAEGKFKSRYQQETNMHYVVQTFLSWMSYTLSAFKPTPQPEKLEIPANGAMIQQEGSAQERREVIDRLRANQYDTTKALKQDLKKLFSLRAYYEPNKNLHAQQALVSSQISKFARSLSTPDCWNNVEIISQARKLLIEAIILTDNILADLECFIKQAGREPTALRMAVLLTDQSYAFCRNFIYTGIIELYPTLREKPWLKVNPHLLINGKKAFSYIMPDEEQTTALFFTPKSTENEMRKVYNTFIRDGFYLRYGSEKGGYDQRHGLERDDQNDFGNFLCAYDSRFTAWTSLDKKGEVPTTETWGQFFSRKMAGKDAPTEERYTYSHPIYNTRPT